MLIGLTGSACTGATVASTVTTSAPTTTAIATTVTTSVPTTESVSTSTATSAAPATTLAEDPWEANALEHRGMDGQRFDYQCTAGGEPDSVWGIDLYTDDSSVCTAAVHAGVITIEEGGSVTIEIREGEESYEGSTRNGITTFSYGTWAGSFVVIGP
jgi:hypothetical protein